VLVMLALAVLPMSGCGEDAAQEGEEAPLVFWEFYDPECPFCAEMKPHVEALEADYADRVQEWRIIDVTTDEGRDLVDEYGVFLTPTFVLLDENGDELDRISGATPKDNLEAFIQRGIADTTGEGERPADVEQEGEGSEL
jgi:thiol-disulfide isomerase/thioredoxin